LSEMAQQSGAAKTVAGSLELVLISLIFYLLCFYLLTCPQLQQFWTH